MSIWTPAREAQLIALWNAGSSAALIAWQFDTTPNAVIGKVHRLRKAGVDLRTDTPTKNFSPGQRASRFGAKAMRAPRTSTQSAQAPSLPAPDSVDPHGACPRTAHPPAQQTVQTVTQLPSDQPERSPNKAAASGGHLPADHPPTPVRLHALRADQCRFPIWPHKALPHHHLYGVMCGGPVAAGPEQSSLYHAPRYCAHHKELCETPRAAQYRETHAGGPTR